MITLGQLDAGIIKDLKIFAYTSAKAAAPDAHPIIRLQACDGFVQLWSKISTDILATRAITARLSSQDCVVICADLIHALNTSDHQITLNAAPDSLWTTTLPPKTGFLWVDDVPVSVISELVVTGKSVLSRYVGSKIPVSLLDSTVLTVTQDHHKVLVPLRVILALDAVRFCPRNFSPHDVVHITTKNYWDRLDAQYGTLYYRHSNDSIKITPHKSRANCH